MSTQLMQAPRFSANLDILRAMAVLFVLFAHCLDTLIIQRPHIEIGHFSANLGRFGVLLFFVHTALVLNLSMERMRLSNRNDIAVFYIRRVFRLFPLAMFCVLLALAVRSPPMPWARFQMPDLLDVLANLTLTTNLGLVQPTLSPLWSLAVEAQMYVSLPLIYLAVRKKPGVALAIWLASLPLAWLQPYVSERLNTLAYIPCFMGGVLAFTLSEQRKVHVAGKYWLPALLLLSMIYLAVQTRLHPRFAPTGWLVCLVLGVCIPLFGDSTFKGLNALAAFVAKYSYGIYLFHPISLWFGCVQLELPFGFQWAVAVLTLVILVAAGYHWIERPAIAYGARVGSRLRDFRARLEPA